MCCRLVAAQQHPSIRLSLFAVLLGFAVDSSLCTHKELRLNTSQPAPGYKGWKAPDTEIGGGPSSTHSDLQQRFLSTRRTENARQLCTPHATNASRERARAIERTRADQLVRLIDSTRLRCMCTYEHRGYTFQRCTRRRRCRPQNILHYSLQESCGAAAVAAANEMNHRALIC